MVWYLTLCGASADTLLGARALRRTVCQRHRNPSEARRSWIPRTIRFDTRLLIDIFYEPDVAGKQHKFLGSLDEGAHLHACPLIEDRTRETFWKALNDVWFTYLGPPELSSSIKTAV